MQTVSTKLDKKIAELFLKVCNDEGKCQSEMLRDMIESVCELEENEETSQDIPRVTGKVIKVIPEPTIELISEVRNPRIVYD